MATYKAATDWLADRGRAHLAALPDALPQYRALDLHAVPGRVELENDRAIAQAMGVILRTRPGEVPQRPEFGSRLPDLIDEPLTGTTLGAIERETIIALRIHEPRANISQAIVEADAASGAVSIDIKWTAPEAPVPTPTVSSLTLAKSA